MSSTQVADQFRDACYRHDADRVRRLLHDHVALRATIDAPLFSFNSPAIVAFAGDAAMVSALLDFGADPNAVSRWWAGAFHALYSATGEAADLLIAKGAKIDACAAAHLDRIDVLKKLIASDPGAVHQRGGDGQTPLHFAISTAVADLLIEKGADLNARDVDHRSSAPEWMLDRRRGAGRFDLARHLVERGAAADIFLAAALGLTDRAVALVRANPSLLSLRTGRGAYGPQQPSSFHIYFWTIGDGRSPLDVATQFEQPETLDAMLAFATPKDRFILACRQADETGARRLLGEHPDLLSLLTPEDHRVLADAAWNGDALAVDLMVRLGFDPRVPGHDSGTALHLAAWEGSTDSVAALLRHSDARELVRIKDANHGGTPLDWCGHASLHGNTSHDHAGVARLLMAAGADASRITAASASVRAVLNSRA